VATTSYSEDVSFAFNRVQTFVSSTTGRIGNGGAGPVVPPPNQGGGDGGVIIIDPVAVAAH
jgi:hypothetical protein